MRVSKKKAEQVTWQVGENIPIAGTSVTFWNCTFYLKV